MEKEIKKKRKDSVPIFAKIERQLAERMDARCKAEKVTRTRLIEYALIKFLLIEETKEKR